MGGFWGGVAAQLSPPAPVVRWETPLDLACAIDPKTVRTPALELIAHAVADAWNGTESRLILSVPPQEGKSSLVTKAGSAWALTRNPEARIGIVSYAQSLAEGFGREVRNLIAVNNGDEGTLDLGLRIARDNGSARRWQLDGHRGGLTCVGVGSGLTGRPLDCFVSSTRIMTERGYTSIRDIYQSAQPPRVLSWNHESGRAEWRSVVAARAIPDREVVEVITTGGRRFACTPDHRIHTVNGYRAASLLRPGDSLTVGWVEGDPNVRSLREGAQEYGRRSAPQVGTDTVAMVRALRGERHTVYDIQVDGCHNFFAEEVLAHNCLIIDDPLADAEQADSQYHRDRIWDWWQSVGATRLAPGAPVIVILTRWHENDIAGRLVEAEDGHIWRVINIPALADHDPDKGQTDPLGRKPGEWLQSARRRSTEQWEAIRVRSGSRVFNALYQGRPSPDVGNVWQRPWWRRYTERLWRIEDGTTYRVDADEVLMSWDMAFKDTKASDYVVGQVWARKGAEVFLLDQVHDRLTFTETVGAFQRMCAKWPDATMKLVEDKANGTAVIDQLRKKIPGIVPENPTDSKYGRATSVAPFIEAGNVLLPSAEVALFDAEGVIEEAASFPNGAHDDRVDATSQALRRLLLRSGKGDSWMEYLRRKTAEAVTDTDQKEAARA